MLKTWRNITKTCENNIKQFNKHFPDKHEQRDADEFLTEINMLKKIGMHKNVVQMFGCVTKTEPHMLIMELILAGNLLEYLKGVRKIWSRSENEQSAERLKKILIFSHCH